MLSRRELAGTFWPRRRRPYRVMTLPDTRDVVKRLSHPHYVANSLLCAVLPALLLLSLDLRSSPAVTTALVAAPVLLALSVGLRKDSDNIGAPDVLRSFSSCKLTSFVLGAVQSPFTRA